MSSCKRLQREHLQQEGSPCRTEADKKEDEGNRPEPKDKLIKEGLHPNQGPEQQEHVYEDIAMETISIASIEKNSISF